MKITTSVILIVATIALIGAFLATSYFPGNSTSPDLTGQVISQEGAINNLEFEGFAPGKSHIGTFDDWTITVHTNSEEEISGIAGTIQVDSVNTGIGGLDTHLKSADFFDSAVFPTIEFSGDVENNLLEGPLTFHGVTNTISFPVEISEDSIKAEFMLDTEQFNFGIPKADKEVRIAFEFSK
jgi:polyisoprenoid-binding protein YceI